MTEQAQTQTQNNSSTNWTWNALDSTKPGIYIGRCQGWLPNRMQCTKAASWEGFDSEGGFQGQYCTVHKLHLESGIHQAPVRAIPNTGTVQTLNVGAEQFEVKISVEPVAPAVNTAINENKENVTTNEPNTSTTNTSS